MPSALPVFIDGRARIGERSLLDHISARGIPFPEIGFQCFDRRVAVEQGPVQGEPSAVFRPSRIVRVLFQIVVYQSSPASEAVVFFDEDFRDERGGHGVHELPDFRLAGVEDDGLNSGCAVRFFFYFLQFVPK